MLVLGAFPNLAEALVVAVLFAALRVPARGLNVALSPRANPDTGPGWGNCQGPDPFQRVRFRKPRPVGAGVRESFSRLLALEARTGIGNISQARGFGGVLWIDNCLPLSAQSTNKTESLR